MAALDIYQEEGLLERGGEMAAYWEDAVHSLQGLPNVIDVRNLGLVAGVELASRSGQAGARAFDVHVGCFQRGALVRFTGDIIAMSPPLIIDKPQVDELIGILGDVIRATD
jgi:beta-alanine--pyruvate transaminase